MSKLDNILAATPLVFDDVSLDSSSTSGLSTPDGKTPSNSRGRRQSRAALKGGRDAWPFLNGVLFLAVTGSILGGVSVGVGQAVDSQLSSARSWRYEFWWGGVMVVISGLFYLPCHFLLRRDYPVGRYLFFMWIIWLCIGETLLLVSAAFAGEAYRNLKSIDQAQCAYVNFAGTYTTVTDCFRPCRGELANKKGNANLPFTCCCCRPSEDVNKTLSEDDIVYFDHVSSCDILDKATDSLRVLTVLYILSFIWLICGLVVAAVVARGCCRVIPPWFSVYVPSAAWFSIN